MAAVGQVAAWRVGEVQKPAVTKQKTQKPQEVHFPKGLWLGDRGSTSEPKNGVIISIIIKPGYIPIILGKSEDDSS